MPSKCRCGPYWGQQVTVKAAGTLATRLVKLLGEGLDTPFEELTSVFPQPDKICALRRPHRRSSRADRHKRWKGPVHPGSREGCNRRFHHALLQCRSGAGDGKTPQIAGIWPMDGPVHCNEGARLAGLHFHTTDYGVRKALSGPIANGKYWRCRRIGVPGVPTQPFCYGILCRTDFETGREGN